ncbi:hypothetical protein FRB90_001659 [Tulasnella sp. 427]|nr:hypothetical protein FRB90_001659 [Tulasnella sp. 427]
MQSLITFFTFLFTLLSFLSTANAAVIRAASSSSPIPSSSSSPTSTSSAAATAAGTTTLSSSPTASTKPIFHAKARVVSPTPAIRAQFDITGYTDGRGTYIKMEGFEGLSSANGPYAYHVHTNPVSADGNCTSTMGHLDPLSVTDVVVCDPASPEYCEEGDLSGKHGKVNGTADGSVNAFGFTDEFLRFFPEELSILGRSIVIHDRNKTRIACGNITSLLDGTADETGQPTHAASSYTTHYGSSTKANATTQALPGSVARPALSLKQALYVNLTMVQSTVTMNNTQTVVDVPTLVQINGTIPFNTTA